MAVELVHFFPQSDTHFTKQLMNTKSIKQKRRSVQWTVFSGNVIVTKENVAFRLFFMWASAHSSPKEKENTQNSVFFFYFKSLVPFQVWFCYFNIPFIFYAQLLAQHYCPAQNIRHCIVQCRWKSFIFSFKIYIQINFSFSNEFTHFALTDWKKKKCFFVALTHKLCSDSNASKSTC